MSQVSRDSQFYTEDGNCVVRVGDTLFKVASAMLSRNSTAFGNYFRSCEGQPPERIPAGTSDEYPIVLRDEETPDDFRAMCWVFQLSRDELQLHLYRDPSILPFLYRLRSILERYGCKDYADWATAAIQQHDAPWTRAPDLLHSGLDLIQRDWPGSPVLGIPTRKLGLVQRSTGGSDEKFSAIYNINIVNIIGAGQLEDVVAMDLT
ncbi:hypothetical protein DFH09DRAFT_1121804 [Mycena vulgaris]|nr:hypothetical protein DFH09DRAFT_1121804 [Mycena vulgaris]